MHSKLNRQDGFAKCPAATKFSQPFTWLQLDSGGNPESNQSQTEALYNCTLALDARRS